MKFFALAFINIFLFTFSSTFGQQTNVDEKFLSSDTLCFKYNFKLKDTLIYKAFSFDSISIDYDSPLLRVREEIWQIVCDSLSFDNNFFLSMKLLSYKATESYKETKDVKVENHNFVGRSCWILIDSLGYRLNYGSDDSLKFDMSPGGAFQPNLLITLGAHCKELNETWSVKSLDDLPENGVPIPLVRQSSLFRLKGTIDTLNENCIRLEFIKTGQGSVRTIIDNNQLRVTNVINGFGVFDLSATRGIPIHFFSTVEQKLTIHLTEEDKQPGYHYINTNYTLIDYKQYVPPKKDTKKNKPTKKK
jgi:hypothetical protein